MKLLLITTLYPAYVKQSKTEVSYAIHYFAKEWAKDNDVQVMRLCPSYPKILKFLKKVSNNVIYNCEDNFILNGVNVTRMPIKKIPKIDYKKKDIQNTAKNIIENIYKKKKYPDIIICDILNPSIYIGEIVAKEFNSKLVASLHNSDILYLSKRKKYKKYIKTDPSIDKIVFRSNKIERQFLDIYNGGKKTMDFSTIVFGIEKKDIICKNKFDNKIKNPMKVILIACSLKKLKKVDVLIEAFSKLDNQEEYILKIIGDGPERKALENLTNTLKCSNYVLFEGEREREEVLQYMEQAEVFAMVSSPETFGLVYVEAMAKGCITIGSKGEGIDGVIVDKENGFLCTPNSADDLKTTLDRVLKLSEDKKYRILKDARATVKDLNYKNLAKEFLREI